MQALIELRRRMTSVRNIDTVTRTMATVASAKLSRTRQRAAGVRVYAGRMRDAIGRQQRHASQTGFDLASLSPFLVPRPVRAIALVHLSGDRGMCGNYNTSVNRTAAEFIARSEADGCRVAALAKGRQGERYLRRRTNAEILSAEGWTRAGVTAEEVDRLYGLVIGWFMSGDYDEVWCTHTQFFSPVRRYPRAVRLLPIAPEEVGPPRVAGEHGASTDRWFYEPGLGVTVGEMLAVFLKLQIEDVLLGSFAAEQGARMITMQEAAERADKTLRELVVRYNRLRRESITTDLLGLLFATRLREGEVVEGNPGTVT